jgi:diaminopimelate decarboxylase/aspartate kinase
VLTAGEQSKFGIPLSEIDTILSLTRKYEIEVVGLHAHAGSGIKTQKHWGEIARFLALAALDFPSVKTLDLGGGFFVPMKPGETEMPLQQLEEELADFKQANPQFNLWLEPGRYLVAEAGVLLSQVNQVKTKGRTQYVGINTGMNSLIRPSLYGSYHHIINLNRRGDELLNEVNIVGPICETGDTLGRSRPFPETAEGDIVLVDSVGAYGRVMGSSYNMRSPGEEVIL